MKEMRIQIQRGHIFISFKKTHESLYDLMLLQQNNRNKPIEVELMYLVLYDSYMD